MQNRDRTFYQYALLSLAILQADFGCHTEAVAAIQEAISIARETHDMNCLNFCMSWLYHFGKAFPDEMKDVQNTGMLGSEKEGLAFLKAKAKETEMWSLLSTSLLSEAKLELQNVCLSLEAMSIVSMPVMASADWIIGKQSCYCIREYRQSISSQCNEKYQQFNGSPADDTSFDV